MLQSHVALGVLEMKINPFSEQLVDRGLKNCTGTGAPPAHPREMRFGNFLLGLQVIGRNIQEPMYRG